MKGLVLVYIVTAAGSLCALRYPLIGLCVYVAYATMRPQFIFGWAGDISNTSLIVGVAFLVGWAFQGFGSWRLGRNRGVVVSLLLFTGWYGISALLAKDTAASFAAYVELLKIVVPFLVGVTLVRQQQGSRALMWTIVLSMGYVGFEMNLEYLRGFNAIAELGFGGMDNNSFGAALVAALGPAVALMLTSTVWYGRLLAAVSAGLILHTTLLTFSRGAMIGLLAVGAGAVVIMPKRPKYIGAVVLIALLAVRLTGPQLAARYSTAFVSEDERDWSAESRVDLWRDCWKVVQSRPFFGVGPGNWPLVAASYGWTEGKSAHSVWMETAADVGLPGVLFLMLFFASSVRTMWRLARTKPTDANRYEVGAATGVVLSIIGFSVAGVFVSVQGLELPYYIVMAGAALLNTIPDEVPQPRPAFVPIQARSSLHGARALRLPPQPLAQKR